MRRPTRDYSRNGGVNAWKDSGDDRFQEFYVWFGRTEETEFMTRADLRLLRRRIDQALGWRQK
jgi:hypothetical protein